jgi:hypothetical protein
MNVSFENKFIWWAAPRCASRQTATLIGPFKFWQYFPDAPRIEGCLYNQFDIPENPNVHSKSPFTHNASIPNEINPFEFDLIINVRNPYDCEYVSRQTTESNLVFAKHYSEMDLATPLCKAEYLPNFFDLHPNQFLAIPKDPETPAGVCAQNVVDNPQTIQANTYSAMAAFILFTQVTERKIRVSSISFDSLNGGARSEPISLLSLEAGLRKIKESRKFLNDFLTGLHIGKNPLNHKHWVNAIGFDLIPYTDTSDIII